MKRTLLTLGLLGVLFLAGLATVRPRSVVAWRAVRAIGLQSDDWGLAGFVPAAKSWDGLEREAVTPGRFPPVYWQSTLEDSSVVARLTEILGAHRGRDGVAAVFQPNYVVSSLAWDDSTQGWLEFDLPAVPPEYRRRGLWQAVAKARERGVWRPEFHGFLHYDPAVRKQQGVATELAREVTRRGILLFPGSEDAWELAPWRSRPTMTAELDHSLAVFAAVFGNRPVSVIAPDYTWDAWIEDLWQSRGLRVIQAKREQRNPGALAGKAGRVQKFVARQWARLVHPDRIYLERNCRLEPVQSSDPDQVVARCEADIGQAWANGEPAVVETHRVNFSHTDPEVAATGMRALADVLDQVCLAPDGPVFLCDSELAQLMVRGTSWRLAGDELILRNFGHAAKVVVVSDSDLARAQAGNSSPRVFLLAPGQVLKVSATGQLAGPQIGGGGVR